LKFSESSGGTPSATDANCSLQITANAPMISTLSAASTLSSSKEAMETLHSIIQTIEEAEACSTTESVSIGWNAEVLHSDWFFSEPINVGTEFIVHLFSFMSSNTRYVLLEVGMCYSR